jgi:hypothetical protein
MKTILEEIREIELRQGIAELQIINEEILLMLKMVTAKGVGYTKLNMLTTRRERHIKKMKEIADA